VRFKLFTKIKHPLQVNGLIQCMYINTLEKDQHSDDFCIILHLLCADSRFSVPTIKDLSILCIAKNQHKNT
jgi:hypothetical protein